MGNFTVITTIVLIVLGGISSFQAFLAIKRAWKRKQPAEQENAHISRPTQVLRPELIPAREFLQEPLPSASGHVMRAVQELIAVLEAEVSFGDTDVQRAIETSLRGRAHLLKPLIAFFLAVFMKAKKAAGASARIAVIQAGHCFLRDIERAQTKITDLVCRVLQDSEKGLVDVIVLADFSLPVAKTLAQLAKLNSGKSKSVRVYLISSDRHFISESDTATWQKQFQDQQMKRFYEVEPPIAFASIATFFAAKKKEGERVIFLLGAERVYLDGVILDWPGVGSIYEIAKTHEVEVLVAAESYKVQPQLRGEVFGYGTAADGSPIQLVPMPMVPGVTFVSDHMIHNVRHGISERPVSLKCCYRHWLNQMEGKNLPIGIIFDLDGTLIDSEPVHKAMYQEIEKSLGYSLSDAEYYSKLRGMTDEETIYTIFLMTGKRGNQERLIEEKQRKYDEQLSGGKIIPIDGAVEFVRKLHRQGHLLALATSATGAEARVALGVLGLTDLFSAVLPAENILHGKPAPDVYENAAMELRLLPSECLVYEDSLAGIRAALSAGLEVVAIGDPRNEMLHHSGAKVVIPDFTDHDLPETRQGTQ